MSLKLGNTVISGVTTPIDGSIAIGQIISSIIPLTDAGLHLLDGALIPGGGVYNDFVQYIAGLVNLYPQCFTDEITWQNTVSNKGTCGKFVYDSTNNTVRLPKITGFIEGTVDSSALGDLVNAGLPNITHTHTRGSMNITGSFSQALGMITNKPITGTGAFSNGSYSQSSSRSGTNESYWQSVNTVNFNAANNWTGSTSDNSIVNSIYGNSSTVQPQSIKVFYYIVIATTTKTDIEVDIDEIVTDLNAINSNAVHKTGNETISGNKTFYGLGTFRNYNAFWKTPYNIIVRSESIEDGVTPSSNQYMGIEFRDKNDVRVGYIGLAKLADGRQRIELQKQGSTSGFFAPVSDESGSIVTTVNKSKSENGYFQLGNGLIIQWMKFNYSTGDKAFTFPTPFTTTNIGMSFMFIDEARNNTPSIKNISTTGGTFHPNSYSSGGNIWLIAVGY